MNKKGQAILSEYVMIFFVVIGAGVAMTVFVQRSFEARIHDARNLLINAVNSACDSNCMKATGGSSIPYEYEPYYMQIISNVVRNESLRTGTSSSSVNDSIGVVYYKAPNERTGITTISKQMPPECANGAHPVYINCASL